MAGLKKIKDPGDLDYLLDIATSFTGEWWPYAYSPFLQSFGGDLINRTDYKSAEACSMGMPFRATWFRSLVTDKYIRSSLVLIRRRTSSMASRPCSTTAPGPRSTPARSSATTPCSCRYRTLDRAPRSAAGPGSGVCRRTAPTLLARRSI